ncbi:putative DNA-binding transcriptional regulator YafY [Spinactinospora alkalitolerans]|uniref:Putative DNA-binding transcriptional regulator YafY n=1 Tax=Spinactinospora alkalitolerans TaxID=687207 RepID=A0A852TY05_9ACTN|nr:YafY family protein [Spinactinospora alkalitolerans]NYE47693.1 putative DNA-binding transcriptional regulator YafY [Spinactinospora alkalitolerans]
MRASRLLSLLLLLQNRGRMTAAQLAAELEVSERTVYRDVDSLSAAGIPVYADRGTGGGYQLLAGYRTRLTGLTGAEADSLFFAGLPTAAAELGLGAEMAAANLKLLAALPEELRERAERVRGRFHLDAPGWFRAPEPTPHLAAIATAVWEEHTVDVHYERWDSIRVQRTLDPLGLVLKGGSWYFLARPHSHRPDRPDPAPRTFRVTRVRELTDTGRTFHRPEGFDLAASWDEWSREFELSRHRMLARVRLTRYGRDMVRTLSSPITAAALPDDDAPTAGDGRIEAVLPIESVEHALVEFCGYGPEIEVLEPPELRERMAETVRATLRLYDRAAAAGQKPEKPA